MTSTEAFAPAKINLTLHVTGQRGDGYHLLDSLVVFADVGDRLSLSKGPEMSMAVTGRFAQGVPADCSNLVWRAAEAAGWRGHIVLDKQLPHGAGLGGGSADAAAVLRCLFGDNVLDGIGLDGALALGADVPVCLRVGPQRMQGVGERLSPVWPVPVLDLVLVNPGVHLATPEVFRALRQRDNPDMASCAGWPDRATFMDWLRMQRNDLQAPACALAPEIEAALAALKGAEIARMSGSGATCFGVYETPEDAGRAARAIAAKHPDWWVVATQTAAPDPDQLIRATT